MLLGLWFYASCDADNPAKFLRQLIKELDGKLKHSLADEKLLQACWAAEREGLPTLLAQVKDQHKRLFGYAPLSGNFVLKRSLKRLGKTVKS